MNNKDEIKKKRKQYYLKNKAHTVASPSSLHRLMVCPASAVLTRYLPEQEASSYALEGTIFHWCMEAVLNEYIKQGFITQDAINNIVDNSIKYHERLKEYEELMKTLVIDVNELKDNVTEAFTFYRYLSKDAKLSYSELKIPMYYSDKDYGTVDCAIIKENKLIVLDWKYGKGVDVAVEDNPQLLSYAVSMLKYLSDKKLASISSFETVETVIYQPRTYRDKVKIYSYTIKDLVEKSKTIKSSVDLVYEILSTYKNKNSKIVTSNLHTSEDGCRFCPAKMLCKKYVAEETALLNDLVEKTESKDKNEVNLVEVGKLFETSLPKLEKFFKEIQDYYLSLKELPDGVYRANKTARLSYISDTDKVINTLNEVNIDCIDHTVKLITLTELKKQLKKLENKEEILDSITEKKEGSAYITFLSDSVNLTDLN